jgi:hypothetical protein
VHRRPNGGATKGRGAERVTMNRKRDKCVLSHLVGAYVAQLAEMRHRSWDPPKRGDAKDAPLEESRVGRGFFTGAWLSRVRGTSKSREGVRVVILFPAPPYLPHRRPTSRLSACKPTWPTLGAGYYLRQCCS